MPPALRGIKAVTPERWAEDASLEVEYFEDDGGTVDVQTKILGAMLHYKEALQHNRNRRVMTQQTLLLDC